MWTSAVLVVGIGLAGGSAAHAESMPTSSADQQADLVLKARQADDRGYIVVAPSDGEAVGGATFYPTGPISDGTLVVIANSDGTLPNGLTESSLDALVAQKQAGELAGSTLEIGAGDAADSISSATTQNVAPLATEYAWSATSASWSQGFQGSSLIGWDDTARASYWFYTHAGYNQRASGNGLGYYRGYNGSVFGTWAKYYYVGTAGSTGAGASVPWGNVAAVKKFRAICTQTTVCGGYFS